MKISKFQNKQQTNLSKELRKPDSSSFLIEIRRSKVKPCWALSKNKKKIFLFVFIFIFVGK